EPTLAGYRLYYATNDALSNWALAADETTLTAATTSVTLTAAQFLVPPTGDVYHFKLTAIVTDPSNGNQKVESSGSDIYSRSSNTTGSKVLIVDGFDRFGGSGSWASSTHSFATSYFKSLRNKAPLQISTAANEKVEDGTVPLSNYDIVVWFVGDESSVDSVFTVNEKAAIRNYLNGGGKLLVSGSEIAYILGRAASAARDSAFINNYLKANYLSDGASTYTPATGVAATPFAGLTLPFGVVYPEDFPDAIAAVNGSAPILKYNGVTTHGGVAYKGTFGSGTTPGAVIYLSFTLETAADATITSFMEKALTYFGETIVTTPVATDDAATAQTGKAKRIGVLANDVTNGVAFTPTTLTIVDQPGNGTASVDAAGSITYISNPGFTGNDSYSYKVQNADGQFSNTATVTITVISALNCDPAAPEVDDAAPKRDLRGAWIATVSNIDWPIRLQTPAQQQAHLIRLLDSLAAVNINAVFLQVRPEADALYASTIEPWSYWLTNNQGVAPSPLWDPLSFAIDAAHARGMELHAWFNPFRAKQSTPTLAANHVVNQHPEWILDIPTSVPSKILDPGLPAVRQYVTDVVIDVATRYDVDGIHFDDYFYPDVITNQDDASFAANNPTSIATKADWRRNNSSLMVAKVYDAIQALNTSTGRNVVFGVSPFGIWKSGTPAGITGNSSYTNQFYDPIAWLQAGKVDYLAPQLYWKITGPQDYNILSKWWNDQGYTYNRYIYPGLALYKMVDANNFPASETQNQIILNRDQSREQIRGQVFYSSKYITANTKGIFTALLANEYKYKALPPAMPWKDAVCPNAPVNVRRDGDTLRWDAPAPATDGDLPRRYVVYRFANMAEATTNLNDASKIYSIVYNNRVGLPTGDLNSYFLVTSVDKNNNESEAGGGILLPVIGLNLTVKLSGNTAVIQWTTITEINTKTFDVERSTDGRNFRYLTSVTAAGNSNSVRNYGAQDFLTEDGTYYYRIKTIDHDGKVSYSGLKSIVYRSSRNEIVLGPNPFESGINISNLQGVKRLEVVDLSGRVLVSRPLANQQNIRLDMPQLPAGSYQLKVLKANGELTYVKLIKL
ncbi:MAG: T9SS type A sorting domain-containing protein, partial [Gammaproteobacteria bacterium]